LFSRAAPPAITAMTMGIYFLSLFIAYNIVGRLSAFYQAMPPASFWAMNAAIPTAGALMIYTLRRPLGRVLYAGIVPAPAKS
jgi:hypothetical protein